jgi:hypothetical protein
MLLRDAKMSAGTTQMPVESVAWLKPPIVPEL